MRSWLRPRAQDMPQSACGLSRASDTKGVPTAASGWNRTNLGSGSSQ